MGKIIEVAPGSEAWHSYRRSRLGASDSAVILGISPWKTPHQLWEDKLSGKTGQLNPAMQRGLDREVEGIRWAEKHFDTILASRVIEHSDYPWKFATVDGISPGGNIVVEIKWASGIVHNLAKKGTVIDYYFSQVQSQIACCDVEEAYFLSCFQERMWHETEFVLVKVPRDQNYIDNMIFAESNFYQRYMIEGIPPELTDRDFEHVKDNLGFDYHCEAYLDINKQIADLEKQKKHHHEHILGMAKDRNSRSDNFKATKFKVKGAVEYDKIPNLCGVNLDDYRKEGREQWRITKN